MNARRPKPTALKERTSARSSLGLSRLFASANDLVESGAPAQDDEALGLARKISTKQKPTTLALAQESDDRTLKLEDPRLKEMSLESARMKPTDEAEYGTAVRVANRPKPKSKFDLDATQTSVSPSAVPHRTSVAKLKQNSEAKSETRTKTWAILCLVPALTLFIYALMSATSGPHTQAAPKSALTNAEIQERLKYYQTTLGQRLNRQRVGVEIENFQDAPALTGADRKTKPPSMLDGVPLQGEANNFQRPKDLPADPTYSEARTGYGLQEEQERRQFEKEAERAWVQEFIENARKDGYEVEIDEFGRVNASKLPDSKLPPPSSSFGTAGGAR